MHILITRPQDDAAELATALTARGIETTLEPLLVIRPAPAPTIDLDGVQALLFTSANGVRCFAAAQPRRDFKVFTVGDNSAAEARTLGFATVESASGDVRSLADLVTDRLHPRDGSLLHAAGSSLAGDLRGQLQAAGFVVNRVVLYDAEPVTELSPATVMNLRLGGIDAVALFSPRTGRIFAELWRAAQKNDKGGLAGVMALCLSAAVANEINDLGWQRVAVAETPDRAGMLALIDRERHQRETAMAQSEQGAANTDTANTDTANTDTANTDTANIDAAAASDAESERGDAARGAAIIAAAPTPPRSGRASAAILGLIAGALAGGGMVVTEPYWRPYISEQPAAKGEALAGDTQAMAAEIAALKEQLAALGTEQDVDAEARSRIDALQSEIANWKSELETATGTSAAPSAAFNLAPLEGRLEALEGRVASLSEALATQPSPTVEAAPSEQAAAPTDTVALDDLAARFAALEEKLATLDTLRAEAATQKAEIETANARLANLDALDGRLASLEETATSLGSDLEQVTKNQGETMLKQQRAAALVLSIGQLRGALGTDRAYAAELGALEDLARPDAAITAQLTPILAPVRDQAPLGAPTLSQLQASFPATDIAQAGTADAAGAAIGVEANWLQQTLNRLAELITVRPVGDVAGDGALAILARAETKLAAGDLAGTVAELDALTAQAATAAAEWQGRAKARLALETAAAQLSALSAEALAPEAAASGSDATQSN